MGWDLVPDSWEDAAENTVEKVGDGVDYASDWTADRMDDAGMHSGANWVRDKGGSVANALGADVGELQLGQTDDEKKLVHGSPEKLRTTAGHLTDFKTAFTNVGNGLKGLDSQHMKGKAADAFREKVAVEPKKWFKAADACEKAATALKDFAGTVQWAQGEAKEAITQYKKGKDASDGYESKRTAYNDAVDTYNAKPADQRDPSSLPAKPGETDPGAADMKAAQEKLDEARRQRNEASGTARTAVQAARDAAPDKPSYSEQVKDGLVGLALDYEHLQGGIIKGTAGVLTFVRSVNPTDPYNLTHPAEYATTLNNTAAGLVRMANDPVGTAKTMYDTFKKDPAEGIGRLIPELLGTRGLGAVKKVATVAKHLPDSKTPGRKDVGDKPDDKCREPACRREGREPVDFATGRMVLRQTDVSLPGSLPLVFRRGFESSYRAGRWFGPTWSSTIDQRLEIDAEGVIFHGEDNLLLAYPHPAPEVPTLPVTGPRWPLERTVEGDYILNDPDTGQVRHFTGPAGGADGTALLEQITDRNDHRINFEYTPDGAPTSVVHDGRYHLKLTTENGRITALHLARAAEDGTDQQLKRYGYTDGHLTSVTNSSGLPLQFGCDDAGRMTSWTDTNGSHFDFAYDEEDRCVWQSGTEGHMRSTFDYSGVDERTGYRITKVTDSLGHTWRYLVNDRLQVVAETEPTGATTRSEWDRYNRLLSRTDALGRATRYRYGEVGEVQAVTRPDGQTIEAEYNHLGLPVAITGVDGACWRQEYDERGNRTAVTDPAGHTTRYAYGEQNHLTAVTDALGSTVQVRCDPAGLPVQITDPGGAVTTYARDAFGRPTAVVDPLEGTTRLSWTVEELSRRLDPDGSGESWIYDGEGNCTRHVDAGGGVTTFEYTHFDLLAAQTGPDGVRHEFTHDTELRLTQVTNPHGLSWSYAYDPAGRLLSETDFDDRTLTYEHDAAGQLASRTNPLGLRVTFERDVLGQITSKDADGQATTYAYDPAGRLTEAVGPDAELLLQRDKLGRIKTELVNGRALTHTYDALGRRTRRMTPSGAVSSFTYDEVGNRTTLTASGHTLDFTHDAAGRETHRRIAGTMDMVNAWDPAGRLTAQTVTGPTSAPVQHRAYTYRPDGHLMGIDDQLNGPRVFDLDAVGRVTGVRAEGWSESYAYDKAGNQTRANWPAQHAGTEARGERAYSGTRLLSAGSIRYEHDAAGRITLRRKTRLSKKPDVWRYSWDAEDHLTSVVTPDGTVWHYRYDPLGRRIAKQRLGMDSEAVTEQVDFTWDGPTLTEQTTTAPNLPNPVTLTWDHDGLRPLTQTERITNATTQREIDSRFFAIITDLIGTPTELLDESGDIAWRTRTTLWGTTTWNTDATTYTPLRFPGQYYDPETALHYNFHRHYDPATARYTSPDPLGLTPAPNPATYVHNPHTWTDPLGLAPEGCPQTHKEFPSRSAAFRGAKRDLGIPGTQQPLDVRHVPMTDKWGNPVLDQSKQPIQTREYHFTREDGSKVIIQDHAAGHQFHEGGVGDQGRHFNVRPYENPRTGKVPGTAQHYEY